MKLLDNHRYILNVRLFDIDGRNIAWSLVNTLRLKFGQYFEAEVWLRLWSWIVSNLRCVKSIDICDSTWPLDPLWLWQCFTFLIRKRHILPSYLASSQPGLVRTFGRITLGSDLGLNNLRPGNSKTSPGAVLGHHIQHDLLANAQILVDQHHQLLLLRNKWIWHLTTGGTTATCPQVGLFNVKSNVKRNIFRVFFFPFHSNMSPSFWRLSQCPSECLKANSKVGAIAEPMMFHFTVNQSCTFIIIIIILCRFEIFSLPYLNPITFWRKIAKRCKAYNTTQCWLLVPRAPKTRKYAKVGPFTELFGTKCSKIHFHSFNRSGGGQSCAGLFKCLLGLKWNGFYFPINDCRRKSFSAIKLLPSRLPAEIMRQSQTLKTSINWDAINWCSL